MGQLLPMAVPMVLTSPFMVLEMDAMGAGAGPSMLEGSTSEVGESRNKADFSGPNCCEASVRLGAGAWAGWGARTALGTSRRGAGAMFVWIG